MIIVLVFLILLVGAIKRVPKTTKRRFTILENKLLEIFVTLFDPELSEKFKAQIAFFENKRKYRQYWKKSMSMELYGDKTFPEELKYARHDESVIATIRFKVNGEQYKIEFSNLNGRLWGWLIRPNPRKIQKCNELIVTSKKVNNDPNEKVKDLFEKIQYNPLPQFKGAIKEIEQIHPIKKAYQPMPSELIDYYKQKVNSKLPEEYIDLITQSEGLEFEDFHILGISEIQKTGLDDGNYFHLVEFDDGIIAVKENNGDGLLYYCHFTEGVIDKLGKDFILVLTRMLKEKSV